ncbi:MAG: DUF4301 family protein [Prevotella sp.]|nr:DUF4301 family protein [Prevotella sp.]
MLQEQDLQQIKKMGVSEAQVANQLKQIVTGFPFLKLKGAAEIGNGILAPDDGERGKYIAEWKQYLGEGKGKVVKFVPASGAASRMFKNLFAFLTADYDVPTTDFEKQFFAGIRSFAFFNELDEACKKNYSSGIDELLATGNFKAVVDCLLNEKGLNYGALPKGLLLFHNYADGARTPMEEHLVEAALYAQADGEANVHFTVSHDHLELFKQRVAATADKYAAKYGVKYNISFSEQKPSTDTIATTMDNEPFRNDDGTLLFRPGGHGALIANLGDIDADVVFIKNIDNVVPDRLKGDTTEYKQLLAGILISLQKKAFGYLETLDSGCYNHEKLEEMIRFLQRNLFCRRYDIKELEDTELVIYLKKKLNRPMRVCGMVRNVGEPGGGPFIAYNSDGTTSLQILESTQIDMANKEYVDMFKGGTHFNPVDLVCATKNYRGESFDLPKYVDAQTGFISFKSKGGKDLKALELPGLWNGAMSDWNTVFVEVPLSTFNPVKTVNDLLRQEHK